MTWIVFAVGAFLSWGLYGAMLHESQLRLGSPMRAMLCVGVAYIVLGLLVPAAALWSQGGPGGFSRAGATIGIVAGVLGALGALSIIYSFRAGGSPAVVMPLVFAGAPVVNVLYAMWHNPPKQPVSPLFYVGILLAAAGAGMVLYFKPQP
jgi:hypothetical protein